VKGFLARLEQIDPGGGGGDVAAQLGTEWQGQVAGSGEVTYTWTRDKWPHQLTFRPMQLAGQDKPFYLCTTEVSMGLFIDVSAHRKALADEAVKRLKAVKPADLCGWSVKGGQIALRTKGRTPLRTWWLPNTDVTWGTGEVGPLAPYPAGLSVPLPDEKHPMHRLPPAAAMWFAGQLNCRLPSAAEWKAAYLAAKRPGVAQANLRDLTWKKQNDYVTGTITDIRGQPRWSRLNVFTVPGVDAKMGKTAQPVAGASDPHLWYAHVDDQPAQPFQHLVGNVAEYVFDAPQAFDEKFKPGSAVAIADVEAFLAAGAGGQLAVIGGSALSPPGLWNGVDKPFDEPKAVDKAGGYADVGLRLVFTAPSLSQRRMTGEVVDEGDGYLPPSPG